VIPAGQPKSVGPTSSVGGDSSVFRGLFHLSPTTGVLHLGLKSSRLHLSGRIYSGDRNVHSSEISFQSHADPVLFFLDGIGGDSQGGAR